MKPVIFGLSGPPLTGAVRTLFLGDELVGLIRFKQNIEERGQLRSCPDTLRARHGRDDLAIMIEQEGVRVSRMQPPIWPAFPPGAVFDRLYDIAPASAIEAARSNAHAIAIMLREEIGRAHV